MKQTARLRLAMYFAAAITAAFPGELVADEKGPGPNPAIPASPTQADRRDPGLATERPGETPPRGTRRDTYPFRGIIATIDTTARTVLLEGKQTRRVIQVTDLTRFEKEGQRAEFSAIKAGDSIRGTLRKNASGVEEAVLIRVAMQPGAAGTEVVAVPDPVTPGKPINPTD